MTKKSESFGRGLLLGVFAVLLVAAALMLSPGTRSAGAAVGDCVPGADWGTPRADLAGQVVDLVNQHRRSIGRVELQVSPTLTNSAVWKARHMAKYLYMQHSDPAPPVARSVGDRLAACGYPTNAGWGENIAYGYATAASVMQGWLNSSGHRANIENPNFRAIGVGAAVSSTGRVYWAQNFGTVVDGGGSGGGGTVAPTVTLTSGPPSSTTSTSASFAWTTSGSPTSTTCSLDSGTAVACSSPRSYSGLAAGTHTFRVTVSNSAGSRSATHTWTITSGTTTQAPTVTLTSAPAASTTSTSASFAWTTSGSPTSTTCSLDSGTAVACSSPRSYSGLAAGTHTFRVTVSNSAGSRSATHTWTIATTSGGGTTTVPTVSFTQTPSWGSRAATFAWTTTGSPTSVRCRLDGGAYFSCSSPTSVSVLAGYHSFRVEASNAAGTGSRTYYWLAF